ncbi:copper resistance protein CopC [Salmonella enterica subsp. enterica]|nr:copper resistance protein CopC [Salmonella enterica subsp. enterica]
MATFSFLLPLASTFATPAARAHAHLTHQYPAANAAVTASPQALTLNFFSEGIEPGSAAQTTTGPQLKSSSKRARQSEMSVIKRSWIIPAGAAVKIWRLHGDWHVVFADGYKTKGKYTFSVK